MNRLTRLASSWLASLTIGVAAASALVAGEIPTANPSELGFSKARLEHLDQFYEDTNSMKTRSSTGSWRASLP